MFRSILIAFAVLGIIFLGFYLFKPHPYTNIQDALKEPQKVHFLDLTHNHLKELPAGIPNLTELEVIWLGNNPGINTEKALDTLAKLPKLYSVDLSYLNLSHLPANINGIKKLKVLDLTGNPSLDFAETFALLSANPALEAVSLSQNNLHSIPSELSKIKSLRKVFLHNNPISKESKETFEKLMPDCSFEYENL
jgi:Leucine-rich repeat (LRR) protein